MKNSCNLSHAHCNLSSPVEKQLEAFGQCMERLSPRALMDVHAGHSTLKYFLYLPEDKIPNRPSWLLLLLCFNHPWKKIMTLL